MITTLNPATIGGQPPLRDYIALAQKHGFGGIEIGIEDDDWQALNVCKDANMLKAIQEGRLVKGMRPVEAYLAMQGHQLYRQKIGEKYVWTWTDRMQGCPSPCCPVWWC